MRRVLTGGLVCALAWALPVVGKSQHGEVRGTITLSVPGMDLSTAGPVVIYLAASGDPLEYAVPAEVPVIEQRNARFVPEFLVVTAGQTIELPNRDLIFHNVFSYSRPNDFDLGLYPKDESRRVKFLFPGFVRMYCSIHESMSASVFVVPSPYWTLAGPGGEYFLRGIPEGSYELRAWSRRLPSSALPVEVVSSRIQRVDLAVGEALPAASEPDP